jgi:ribosomal protein S18 acetylase RimI-like enzyme
VNALPVSIRRATPADAGLLAELGAKTFRDTFGVGNTEEDMTAYLASAFGPATQAAELREPGTIYLIAEASQQAIGYARLRFGPSPPAVGGRRPVEIARFYVDLSWIGRGAGARLMRASLDLAIDHACDTVWLDVWERNAQALAFYTKWGFTIVGSQPFRLGTDIQNDWLMARSPA